MFEALCNWGRGADVKQGVPDDVRNGSAAPVRSRQKESPPLLHQVTMIVPVMGIDILASRL